MRYSCRKILMDRQIASQQDYYNDILKDTIPKTLIRRVFGFIH